jgi:type I restriction enzyme S subunit
MAAGYPLLVNNIPIRTSEALYQSMRLPTLPEAQQKVFDEPSPIGAKICSRKFLEHTRADWERIKIKVMLWSLRIKLLQNREKFGEVLLSTDELPIVEQSSKDEFWGAKVTPDGTLVGMNVLGRLLVQLREEFKAGSDHKAVEPLDVPEFLLLGEPVRAVGDFG